MTYKMCSKCKENKSILFFGKDKHKVTGLTHRCKECRKEDRLGYYEENKENCLAATKRWTLANSNKYKETTHTYYVNNKERIIKRSLTNQRNNKARYNSYAAKYRASKFKATPSWADEGLINSKYWYAQWLSETVGVPYEVDHIVPLQNKVICGLHTPHNLQVIPMVDNRRKSNKFKEK